MNPELHPLENFDTVSGGATSWTLIESARRGVEADRTRLFYLYEPLIRGRYLARVPRQDVDALCQEIFLTIFTRLGEFERGPKGKSFRPWIYQIARNKVGDYLRARRRDVAASGGSDAREAFAQVADSRSDGLSDPDAPDELSAEVGLYSRLLELARFECEPSTWEAAVRTINGESPASVGADLGLTANAVRIAKCRVLSRIRDALRELGEPDRSAGVD